MTAILFRSYCVKMTIDFTSIKHREQKSNGFSIRNTQRNTIDRVSDLNRNHGGLSVSGCCLKLFENNSNDCKNLFAEAMIFILWRFVPICTNYLTKIMALFLFHPFNKNHYFRLFGASDTSIYMSCFQCQVE